MKKFLSIVTVLAIVLSLSVTALAAYDDPNAVAVPSVTFDPGTIVSNGNPQGTHVEIRPISPDRVNKANLIVAAGQLGNKATVDGYDVFEIVVVGDDDGLVKPQTTPITVTFSYDKLNLIVAAFLQNDDETWEKVTSSVSNGVVTLNLPHLSPVAFALKSASVTPGGDVPSPQTGYDTTKWIIAAATMTVLAGIAFVVARKKVTE